MLAMKHHFCQNTMSGCEVRNCQHLTVTCPLFTNIHDRLLNTTITEGFKYQNWQDRVPLNVHKYETTHREPQQRSVSHWFLHICAELCCDNDPRKNSTDATSGQRLNSSEKGSFILYFPNLLLVSWCRVS